jgi:hypothetical protein
MKKVLLVLMVLFCVITVSAQGFKLGVKAGFNASNMTNLTQSLEGEGFKNPFKPGFQLGVVAQYMLTSQFGLETGLSYSQIGGKLKIDVADITTTLNPSYLQLPITALYKFSVGQDLFLYPQAGIYLGYGIGGKIRGEGSDLGTDVNFFGKFDGEQIFNRFDAGLTGSLNLQYANFVLGAGYDYGLTKVNKESFEGGKDNKNVNVKVTLGYFF